MTQAGQAYGFKIDPARRRAAEYATADEFCAIFRDNMKPFYVLALWLTASDAEAEQCFIAALSDCRKSTGVFRPWAYSWSQLAIVKNAIRIVQPSLSDTSFFTDGASSAGNIPAGGQSVMRLSPFDRFVYVLSVLDRYSSRDCAILLGCRRQDIERAKRRAIDFIAAASGHTLAPAPAMETRLSLQA
jgi:hypothetical protein